MKFSKVNNSLWEVEADQADLIRKVGIEICSAAFSDAIGIVDDQTPEEFREHAVYFSVRFNGLLVEFSSKREMYMFGLGLQLAVDAIPIQLIGLIPAKASN